MKKLITILTIMIVLVGAVFATDPEPIPASEDTRKTTPSTAAIDIRAEIAALNPQFSLSTNDATDLVSNQVTNESTAKTTADLKPTVAAGLVAGTDATVTFNINQITLARTDRTFTLSVAATDMVITHAWRNNAYVEATPAEKALYIFEVDSETPEIDSVNADIEKDDVVVAEIDKSDNEITIVYNGTVNPSDYTTSGLVGSFDVTWGHNNNNIAGKYVATVTLTITSN